MVALAMTLALSLTVTTTQRAEATPGVAVAPVIAAAEGVLAGGVRLALPSLLSIAIATTPVGWIIGGGLAIGALAVGAYATRDYWVPFVAGAFGQPDPDKPAPEGTKSLAGFNLTTATPQLPNRMAIGYTYQGSTSSKTYTIQTYFDCRQLTNTPPRVVGEVFRNSATFTGGVSGNGTTGAPVTGATGAGRVCPDGSEMIGGTMGPDTFNPNGPMNVLTYGSFGAFNPKGGDVKYKTTAECIDDGGNKSTVSAEWFGDEGGAKIPSCAAAGKGHGTGKIGIEGYAPTAPGVPGTVAEPVWETQAPTSDPDHPLCGPQRPGPGCEMKIVIDGKPCTVGAWECENWADIWNDPTTAPRVGCTYGPYTLAVDLCRIMEPAYRPGGAPATEENMDGDPATRNYTQPGGTTYTPPSTGTGTAPGGFPSAGVNPSTGTSPNCSSPTWSWNPVEFVRNPVFCTLQDAFIPKTDIGMRSDALRDQASEVVPISWLSSPITGPSGGGCPNWTINVQGLSKNVVCDSSFTSALVGVRGPLFGLVAAAMVWPLIRGIWYASIPVLRVSPGSSK